MEKEVERTLEKGRELEKNMQSKEDSLIKQRQELEESTEKCRTELDRK